jgi:hypothetical protein
VPQWEAASRIPHAGAVGALVIAMIEAAFGTAAVAWRAAPVAIRLTGSHETQIAKMRLQRRHAFWRSRVSTTSERLIRTLTAARQAAYADGVTR